MRLGRFAWLGVLAIALAAAVWLGFVRRPEREHQNPIGLFTSLPIMWNEHDGVHDMLAAPGSAHWARGVLKERGRLVAYDTLLDLSRVRQMVIAQPRPLSPDENVALDNWVRSGGRMVLFADPMLTQQSAFPLGDRRRPQDVVLLSPILARWGLELRFDDAQAVGERESAGEGVTVNLPGQVAVIPGGVDARCSIGAEALIARCKIGAGQALIVADAALLEPADNARPRIASFRALLDEALTR